MSGILHFHDQASVAKNLVLYGKAHNLPWRKVWRYPEFTKFTIFEYQYTMAAQALARSTSRISNSFLHIHGGHLHRFASKISSEYVLHLHGSEIRVFDEQGNMHSSINDEVESAIQNARLVIYSTPDLAPFVNEIRKDAVWLPNPISESIEKIKPMKRSILENPEFDIFWPHAWSYPKGYSKVLDLVARVCDKLGRSVSLLGIALGEHQKEARDSGFTLVPVASRQKFWQLNSRAQVTLGQGLGFFGVSDLECMAIARNYVNFPLEHQTRLAYDFASGWIGCQSEEETFETLLAALKSREVEAMPNSSVTKIHNLENVGFELERIYRKFGIGC